MSLFRDEVLAARSAGHLGSIRIGRPLSFSVVTVASLALAAALAAFATWGHVTRKVRVAGVLMPTLGSLQLNAMTAGILLERRVAEGDVVAAGTRLFVIDTDRTSAQGDTAILVARSLQLRRESIESERHTRQLQARQRSESLDDRIRTTQKELGQSDAEIVLTQRRVELAAKSDRRFRELAAAGFVADIQSQQKQEELIDLQARAQTAERARLSLQSELRSLEADLAQTATQLATDLAQLDRNAASLDQESSENEARRQAIVTAPRSGTVTGLTLKPGAAVQAGQTLATLIPDSGDKRTSELEAQLYAPSRTAGFVRPGQSVWLRYAAYPYQKFGMAVGDISAVSHTPINASDLPAGQAQALARHRKATSRSIASA